ncbi:hypothetical protein D3C79_1061890 [compost metagenome]
MMSLQLSRFLLIPDFHVDAQNGYRIAWMEGLSLMISKRRQPGAVDCGLIRSRERVIFWLCFGITVKM